MSRHSAVLFLDPDARLAKLFHRLHDGGWAHETVQDVQPILDANKEAQNHCDARSASGELRLVARVPAIFIQKWFDEEGIDFWSPDPDMQRRVDARLNDPAWRWLRTDGSVL